MLRQSSLKVTRPRVSVLSTVYDHPHADTNSIIGLVREDIGDVSQQTVYDVLESSAHVAIQHGVVTVEPMTADRSLAHKLKIPAGSLLLYLRQVDYDRSGDPVLLSHEYHLGDAFEFSVVRRGPGRRFR